MAIMDLKQHKEEQNLAKIDKIKFNRSKQVLFMAFRNNSLFNGEMVNLQSKF
jgi:hypothetical protein